MIRKYLSKNINTELFGDRKKYGNFPQAYDNDWIKFQKNYLQINKYQKNFLIKNINNMGYKILKKYNFENLNVCDFGPGYGHHLNYVQSSKFENYDCYDVFDTSETIKKKINTKNFNFFLNKPYDPKINQQNEFYDYIFAFYSIEHLYPLEKWIKEILRVLKKGGKLICAIPCEGGLAWGLGRYFSTRKALYKDYKIEMKKIICWEHPNYVDDIINTFKGQKTLIYKKPFDFLPLDLNFVVNIIYEK